MRTESVTTHELKVGDRVLDAGMILRIDTEPVVSTAHPVNEYAPTLWTDAVIENWNDLVRAADTDRQIAGFIVGIVRSDMAADGHRARNGRAPYDVPRWTIQGNGLARWPRIIAD
jgi:hypothetical protein